jgi:tetratricopeptide (TPR) repeat protein
MIGSFGLLANLHFYDNGVRFSRQENMHLAAAFFFLLFQGTPGSDANKDALKCLQEKKDVSERIRCVQPDLPAPSSPNRPKPSVDTCEVVRQWRKLAELENKSLSDDTWKTVNEELNQACLDQDRLLVADKLLAQNRFSEAAATYEMVRSSKVPVFADRARYGANITTENKNVFVFPPTAVLQLESEGRFEEAYDLDMKVAPESDPHRKSLSALVGLRKSLHELLARNEAATALSAYTNLKASPTLDSARDRYLIDAVEKEIPRLQLLTRNEAEKEVNSLVTVGDLQFSEGQFATAASTFEKALGKKTEISADLARTVNGKLASAREQAAREPSVYGTSLIFIAQLKSVLLTFYRAFLYSLLLLPVFVVAFAMKMRTRQEILLTMEDPSASTPQGNQTLTDQLRREMEVPSPTQKYQIDTPANTDGSSLGQLAIRVALRDLETAFQADPIKFGGFSINPIQLFSQFRAYLRPRYRYEFEGSVTTNGSDRVCVVNLVRSTVQNFKPKTWQATASGDTALAKVLRDTAAQIMVDIDKTSAGLTRNWRSLSQLRLGISLLRRASNDPSQRATLLPLARTAFEEALIEDSSNWLARFNLANSMRTLGLHAVAAEHFEELEQQPKMPAEFLPFVKYNRAAALQMMDDERLSDFAAKLLREVLETPDLDTVLYHLAYSGLIAAHATWLTRRRRRALRAGDDFVTALKDFAESLREDALGRLKDAQAAAEATGGVNGSDYTIVQAVFLNALGQVHAVLQQNDDARQSFRRAMTFLPTFIEARLNLAELYIERERSLDANWANRAEALLLRVRETEPNNKRALVLLGRLYHHPIFNRIEDAKTLLKSALPDPGACLLLGTILFQAGSVEDAIPPLLSLLEQETTSESGQLLLARCVLALPPDNRNKCQLLPRVKSDLTQIAFMSNDQNKKTNALSLLPKSEEALSTCK